MAKSKEQMLAALVKLYDKRAALDKQIIAAEKTLVVGVEGTKTAAKAVPAKAGKAVKKVSAAVTKMKPTSQKPRGRKPAK